MNSTAFPLFLASPQRRCRAAVATATALAVAALPVADMGLDLLSFAPLLATIAFLLLLRVPAQAYAPRLAPAFEVTALLLAALLPILLLSFAAMRFDAPLADSLLVRLDAMIGADALAIVRLVDQYPLVAAPLGFAYSSFSLQVGLLPILLVLGGQERRGFRFVAGFVVLTLSATMIAAFFPALGTLAHAGFDRGTLHHVDDHFAWFFLDSFHKVRGDAFFVLSADRAAGILTFPSVHAGVAVLCGWAGWTLRTRWVWAALNAAMFLSAVTHGAHYVIDIVAGGALAAAVIAFVSVERTSHAENDGLAPAVHAA